MIADLIALARLRLGLMASAGAAAGYVLWRPYLDPGLLLTLAGALLLAAGCSALNQVQERHRDALMTRTRQRPLPERRLTREQALALAWLLSAMALLCLQGGVGPWLISLVVVALYNGAYTPLKGRTPFALLLGALAGALPPLLGWMSAGGPPLDPRVLLVTGVFYCWQVPHFALMARLRPGDYQAAGLPLAGLASAGEPGSLTLKVWLAAYGATLVLGSVFALVATPAGKIFLAVLALAMALSMPLIRNRGKLGLRLVNASLALYVACLMADCLWRGA